jgi:hypothetical protein
MNKQKALSLIFKNKWILKMGAFEIDKKLE